MGSETTDSGDDRVQISTSRKNSGKVPRKVHKAAREKLKRDHMNELFLDLGKTLDVDQQHGKASMLRDTIRVLGELATQMESLKKENVALLSEYNYITSEKNELVEETCALDAQVKRLQSEIEERANSCCSNEEVSSHVASETARVVGPVFVIPPQGFPNPYSDVDVDVAKLPSGVSKPRPRYPSSSDGWPSHILTK